MNRFSRSGFTLIEIVSVLVILGILAAVAVPKYFDLQAESEKKAALSSVAEAQARIQLSFGQQLLQGKTCEDAAAAVSDLSTLSDDTVTRAVSARFGEFYLTVDTITVAGTSVSAKRGENGTEFDTGAKLYLPSCDGDSLATVASKFMVSNILEFLKQRETETDANKIPIETNTTLANGVTVTRGASWQNRNGTATAHFTFQNGNKEKVEFKLTSMANGKIHINNMDVYTAFGKKQLVHNITVHTSANDISAASAVLKNLGFNTDALSQVLTVGNGKGEIDVDKSFFGY